MEYVSGVFQLKGNLTHEIKRSTEYWHESWLHDTWLTLSEKAAETMHLMNSSRKNIR